MWRRIGLERLGNMWLAEAEAVEVALTVAGSNIVDRSNSDKSKICISSRKFCNGNIMSYSFKDLKVYHIVFSLVMTIFEISKSFPFEEGYSLTE